MNHSLHDQPAPKSTTAETLCKRVSPTSRRSPRACGKRCQICGSLRSLNTHDKEFRSRLGRDDAKTSSLVLPTAIKLSTSTAINLRKAPKPCESAARESSQAEERPQRSFARLEEFQRLGAYVSVIARKVP